MPHIHVTMDPQLVVAVWRSLAHTSIKALCSSGKAPIALVRRLILRFHGWGVQSYCSSESESDAGLENPYRFMFLRCHLPFFCSFAQFHRFQFFSYLDWFLPSRFFAFLSMDFFQHESYCFHLVTKCSGKDIFVEMHCTTLISGVWENFQNGFQHPQIFIPDN